MPEQQYYSGDPAYKKEKVVYPKNVRVDRLRVNICLVKKMVQGICYYKENIQRRQYEYKIFNHRQFGPIYIIQ
jgi:hypothetical protein